MLVAGESLVAAFAWWFYITKNKETRLFKPINDLPVVGIAMYVSVAF